MERERVADVHGSPDRRNRICIPIPRYTIPILIGLAKAFPRETLHEGFKDVLERLGDLAPVAVAANEAADIGVSAELRLKEGCRQGQFVPLLELRNQMLGILKQRSEEFFGKHPEMKDTVEAIISDFLLLSREGRDKDKLDPKLFLELDSGIIEALFTAVAFPKTNLLEQAGVGSLGTACTNLDELKKRYSLYDLSLGEPSTREAHQLRELHMREMAMKVNDDRDGQRFDGLMGLPSFYSIALGEQESSGRSVDVILNEYRDNYLKNVAGGGIVAGIINKAIIAGHRISAGVKNSTGLGDIEPTGDLWQLSPMVGRLFDLSDAKLRHQLLKSRLLDAVFR